MPKKLTRTLEFTLKFSNPGKLRELEEFTEKENRNAEVFKCLRCGFSSDADHVGALNILSRFYEELEVPHVGKIRDG